jgi:putative hydrolase of the HAD superfamily
VLSNHVPELPGLIADLGLGSLVDDVLTSASIGYEKPHPEIFQHALRQSGHPTNAWMVGDSVTADIGGAELAGIPALLVRTGQNDRPGPDLAWAADVILGHQQSHR